MSDDRWRDTMREALSVDGGAEGVPMLLALCDERTGRPASAERASSTDGQRIAAALDECRDHLAPSARDEDLATTATLLAVLAHEEFGLR